MTIYLDDNQAGDTLAVLLTKAGFASVLPRTIGLGGANDPVHFTYAIQNGLIVLTGDRADFRELHDLIVASGGHHHGVLLVAADNNSAKDMKPRQIVAALRKLRKSGLDVANQTVVLNHWR